MKNYKDNIVTFLYKCKKPKKLENDVFVIYSPERITINPGEIKNVNMKLKIFLPKYIEGRCRLLLSFSNQKLKLLNSNLITQKYNQNIEIEDIYKNGNNLPSWNLYFELLNVNFTNSITIKSKQELGYFYLMTNQGEEITYKFEKKKHR